MPVIRCGVADDLAAVAAIQAGSPEASQWEVVEYLQYQFTVSVGEDGTVAGFLVWRTVASGECELLNLAVAPGHRRKGIARQLLAPLLNQPGTAIFLEVRESNEAARFLYKSMGFKEVSVRHRYYEFPLESAIVMKFHSC